MKMYPRLCAVLQQYGFRYDFILMDPAYYYRVYFTSQLPYVGKTLEELLYIPIEQLRKSNNLLAMWSTGTHLFWCLHLYNVWNYWYINILVVWRKVKSDGTT